MFVQQNGWFKKKKGIEMEKKKQLADTSSDLQPICDSSATA